MFLSVIISTHNRKDILERCIDSLLNQSLSRDKYELIIVDDGSNDGTKYLVGEKFVPRGNIVYLYQAGKGPAAARNLGIKNAKGEIILFTGDDIIADRNLLQVHYQEHLQSDKQTAILGFVGWHPSLKITRFMRYIEQGVQFSYGNLKDQDYVVYGHFVTSNVSLKKEFLQMSGGFDEDFKFPCYEDIELAFRLNGMGMKLKYIENAKAYHYHPTDIRAYSRRQYLAGESLAIMVRKHHQMESVAARTGNNLLPTFLKKTVAQILIKPLEWLGSVKVLNKCYFAVLNYYKILGFLQAKGR